MLDWDHNAYYHRLLLRQMRQPCRRVLDVGCGAGAFAARLAQRNEQVDALDRSAKMIEEARRRHRLLGAIFLATRFVGSNSGFAKDSAHATMPMVMDPPLTTREVAHQAAAVLPGARVRRLLFWRYLLIWQKPITPDS